ncbi:bifunctional UDP-N-acetylglucosamine pyrophosphorylase/glucosamine-1-phosphate N-acetyltransferase [Ruminiclostridium sufflavum DSM 19573]|uniref:Bifunctional UDP-N-acetylglucosamine pyrophosphorylase/glucosamine-1-phosphate N-acetyltransferase n=1 Tax=Ruminiclostridium sufflavum DSM 19573 TaxID=1121337 RepID=A0A318XZC3_9FIRM|nr:DapH/DapD/GlmU-related protein [Ruminiclostridium sufflavum]PYG88270.1 bifunctional UDP-N-acetylglucosamine pyrophosphorylase/glucosamine-1-phosphate N-acetyltransferase [Ruminiclostridium sufflavum DSM 19573]
MNMYLGLIISDNNNDAFKSKTLKEHHNILGKSVRQWSEKALEEITGDIQYLSFEDLDKCKEILCRAGQVIINWADQPLILPETANQLFKQHTSEGNIATALYRGSGEAALYAFECKALLQKLNELNSLYISRDILNKIFQSIDKANKIVFEEKSQFLIVKDRVSLNLATEEIKARINQKIMLSGVTLIDPVSTYIDFNVSVGMDTTILPNTILQGKTIIGEDCIIGPNSRISGCSIGNDTEVANSVAIDSSIGNETHVGPFAYLRPGSTVGRNVKIGDFVEIKKSNIGDRTKISHLTYVGDAEIGENVNIGCGVVVVNYDGKHKNKTIVEDNCFIGCNTNLISPVVVHSGAYTAAGSTITDAVPENSLAIARERQVVKHDWVTKKGLGRE